MIMIEKNVEIAEGDLRGVEEGVQRLLHVLGYDDFDLGIKLTTNE